MSQQSPSRSSALNRHLSHVEWLLDEWTWHAFLAAAVFTALAGLVA